METGQVSYHRYTQNQGSHDFKVISLQLRAEPSSSKCMVCGLMPHTGKKKKEELGTMAHTHCTQDANLEGEKREKGEYICMFCSTVL